ncbi:T9SS type A sorting domain-containing protein [Flavobacterium sp.]|uniref:T9SS type A sorting domain-containing protein n=1 Tax=Flavobacterium sp. TaxID=239 RepID=UPI0025B84D53|nr:T9SS type A sorting domain-containing protein [Flavobacterium sp.]
MKKTLLFFILLFSNYFYAQVNDIKHCAGDTSFNLTTQKTLLIGNLNPAETTVSYHLSLADATDNLNVITNPESYSSTESSKTIYARIDHNGSITTNYFNLIVNPALTADARVEYVNCVPRIVISGNGGDFNYEYSHFGVTYTQNNVIITPSPGNQTVYVRDGNGCVASKTIVVESLTPLTWLANMVAVTCQGGNDGTFQVTASGGKAPYLYSIADGAFTSANVFKNLTVGDYTVRIKDATGCIISLPFTMRLLNTPIAINPIVTNDSNAANAGKIELLVSGGVSPYTFALKDSGGNPIPSKTTNPFTGLAVGSYEVVVTDRHGCILSQKGINILNEPTPLTTTASVTPITCVITTGTITITPNGGTLPYQYSIDNGNTYSNSNVFSNLSAGTYDLKVLDAQNAVVTTTATIDPIKIPLITATYKSILCHGDSNGSILVGTSNGKSPILFSINGKPYSSNNLFENLPAGNYTLSAKDSNGCIVSTTVVLEDPTPITAQITYYYRTVTVNASGGYGKYQYALDGGSYQDSRIFGMVTYGNHTISIKDPNKCTVNIPITVVEPTPLVSSYVVDKGTVTITTSGGITPYSYRLQKSSGTPLTTTQSNIFTNLVNGSYDIIVSDSQGGQVLFSNIIISESIPFTAIANATPITCTDLKSTLTVTPTGGSAPYQYSMTSPENFVNSNVFSNLNAGSYQVTVRDSNGSRTIAPITIASAKPVLASAQIILPISCNSSSDGVVRINVTQGQSPYTYALDNGQFQTDDTFRNVGPGTHTLHVLDKNSCRTTVSITLLEPTLIQSTLAVNGNSITASSTGGTPPYKYSLESYNGIITDWQDSNTFDNLPVGTYTVRTIDTKGCFFQPNYVEISQSPVLLASAVVTPITCENAKGKITVYATGGFGPYSYSIDNGVSYVFSNVFSGLSPGNYVITVKDNQNTTTTIMVSLDNLNILKATAVITKIINCSSNATINVTASGGKKPYQYSLDNGTTYTSNPVFTNLNAGNYFVRVKDSLDCSVITNSIILQQPVPLTATVDHTTITDCSSSPISHIIINATGGTVPYQYSLSGLPYQSSSLYSGAYAGNYILDVMDANGCKFSIPFVIASPVSLVATVGVSPALNCEDNDTVTITATGGQAPYTYSFDGLNNFSTVNVSKNLTAGTYMLHVKDRNGCYATVNVDIAPHPLPTSTVVLTNATTAGNNNGSITVTATGGTAPFTYSLLNSNNVIIIAEQSSNTFNNLVSGTYSVVVKDAKGCSSIQQQLTISEPNALSATAIVVQPTCYNAGKIIATAIGGTFPYEYSIDNGATYSASNEFLILQPGNYVVTVRDSNNDTYRFTSTIMSLEPLVVNAVVVSAVSCFSNGVIEVRASGGKAPYFFSINGGSFQNAFQSTTTFTGLNPGDHIITIKDANDCNQTVAIRLAPPVPITAVATVHNQTITVTAAGGTGSYQFSLDGIVFQSSNIFTVVNYGTYQITVKDQSGCMQILMVTIDPPAPLIDGKKEIAVTFKAGQTLGDLVIEGQNIKWYSTKGASTGKTSKTAETPLSPTTLLVDGVTYYASQTIDGIESKERLAVTAKVDGSLATPDFALSDFRFYPNPVQHTLSVHNTSAIDEVELISVSGKTVLIKKINDTHSEIDLSNVASGFYFLKVKAEGKLKTVKIVKK